jgi:protein arginine kinase
MSSKGKNFLNDIVTSSSSPWMDGAGELSEVVISSRVRLARNLKDISFPHLMEETAAKKVRDTVFSAIEEINKKGSWSHLLPVDLSQVSGIDRQVLVEKHLMSPQHAQEGLGKGLAVSKDEKVSIMVNEEDHLRIQCLYSGLELEEAWITASGIDDLLDAQLDFAYDANIGFLTACPTNVGTGLRASIMVHLPALTIREEVARVIGAVNKVGFVVRGLYGEGTAGKGNVFQMSNQVTLGHDEKEIIDNLSVVAKQVIAEEKRAREALQKSKRVELEDRIMRSLGILSNARIMTSSEAVRLWSDVRLGVDLGFIPGLSVKETNEILVLSQPNFVQKCGGRIMCAEERDIERARLIRERFSTIRS